MKSSSTSSVKKIVIFASGTGTNAENIIRYFRQNENVEVAYVLSNKSIAPVLEKAEKLGVKNRAFNKAAFYETGEIAELLKQTSPDLIVLAGFLWLLPTEILKMFPEKIINIHPALLPKYGGKGMFGSRVHEAVLKNKEAKSGISIHYVNEKYDEGKMIAQFETEISLNDSAEEIAAKIHELEQEHFPKVIEKILFPKKQ
ncbi:MAG TPA: phosphoribosylglycinamide formyltransferase [Flavobacteriaceae bacterium]|nr:phosphoribosylglycinamide formyltransferase [Flavobacteriaceae bacterium]